MKIVLTGPPGSGKTTTFEYLRNHVTKEVWAADRLSFFVEESAISLIETLNEVLGVEQFADWRKRYNIPWQSLVATKQVVEECADNIISKDDLFVDSSPIDSLAFAECIDGKGDDFLKNTALYFPSGAPRLYDLVFYHELIEPFNARSETGRLQSREDSLRIGKKMEELYLRFGMTPIKLPSVPVKDRVAIIKDHYLRKLAELTPQIVP